PLVHLRSTKGAPPAICALIWTESSTTRIQDFSECLEWPPGQQSPRVSIYKNGDEELPLLIATAKVERPSSRVAVLELPTRAIGSPTKVSWRVRTFYRRFDFAPNVATVSERRR